MAYRLRPSRQNIAYADPDDSESNSNNQDQDYSRLRPRKPTKRRNETSSSTRAFTIEKTNEGMFSNTKKGKRGPRRRPSKKTTNANEEQQNKEASGVGQSSHMERDSIIQEATNPRIRDNLSSREGHNPNLESNSSLSKGSSSSKKNILSWLIDHKNIDEDEQVYYIDDTKESAPLTGVITRDGIHCNCCQEEISVWTFEKHAHSELKQPYEHICLPKKGERLEYILTSAWNERNKQKSREPFYYQPKLTTNPNDGVCSICGDGADLIYCTNDRCYSAYHASCMNLQRIPRGTWNCPYCLCTYCGLECKQQPITCVQCDKIFHWECFNKFSKESREISSFRLYCSHSCKEIYEKLETSLAKIINIPESYSWRVVRPVDMITKLHLERTQRLENNLKVAVAFSLMNESFKTITDQHTNFDVVHGILFSHQSNLRRINCNHFHTFILEKNDEIISAASIRIHGRSVAEMPLIATDVTSRGKGMCRKLLMQIELFLGDLEVQNLIIQADSDTSEMWKLKFGFKELTEDIKKKIASFNIFVLPKAIKLYKDLQSIAKETEANKDNENHNANQTRNDRAETPWIDLNSDPN